MIGLQRSAGAPDCQRYWHCDRMPFTAELDHQSLSPSSDHPHRQKTFGILHQRPKPAAQVLTTLHANHSLKSHRATTRNLPPATSKRRLPGPLKKSVAGLRNPASTISRNADKAIARRRSSLRAGLDGYGLGRAGFVLVVVRCFEPVVCPPTPSRWAVLPNSRRGEDMVPPDHSHSVLTFSGHRAVLRSSSCRIVVRPHSGGAQ